MTGGEAISILRRMSRLFRFAFASFATLFALAAILIGLVSWKMAARPLSSQEWTPYVEAVLARVVPEGRAKIGKSTLFWDNQEHTLALECEDLRIEGPDGAAAVSFPSVRLKLGLWSLLRGRMLPIELKADNAQFWLTRRVDGSWTIGAGQGGSEERRGAGIFSILQNVGDEIANRFLEHDIAIKQAVWAVRDETLGKDWSLTAREITLAHQGEKAQGQARIEVLQGENTSFLDARYFYERQETLHKVELSFEGINPAALASQHPKLAALSVMDMPLSGRVSFGTDRALNVSAAALKVEGGGGRLRDETLWDAPLDVQKMNLLAVYGENGNLIELKSFSFDFGGTILSATGVAAAPLDRRSIWAHPRENGVFSASVKLENLPIDRFAALWPKEAVPGARAWIAEHMSKGKFDSGTLKLEGAINWDRPAETILAAAEGKIAASGARVTYMDGMPAIDDVSAEGTFDLTQMDVKILSGHTGDVKIKPFTLIMTDFEKDVQNIVIPVQIEGPSQSVLRLLDSPALGYAKKIGLDPADVGGRAEGVLTLSFPMLDDLLLKDISYGAEATFKAFELRNMIPKTTITQGELAFRLDENGFTLAGPASFNGASLALSWKSRFEGAPLNEATVSGAIKEEGWRALGLEKEVTAEGKVPVTIRYVNAREGLSTLSAAMDLKDVAFRSKTLGFFKPREIPATVSLEAEIEKGKNVKLSKIEMKGDKIDVRGTAELTPEGSLIAAKLDPYLVGRSDAVFLLQDGAAQQPLRIEIKGNALDISGFESGKSEGDPSPVLYDVQLKKLYTSEKGFLSDVSFKGKRDELGWKDIDFKAYAQGKTQLRLTLRPEGRKVRLNMAAPDFGQMLKGLGFTNTVSGGDFWFGGVSTDKEPRTIKGKIKIGGFSVSGLPVLARLLSAVSPFGFVDLIKGETSFDHLRGRFSLSGDKIELKDVQAPGSVVGLTLEGRVNMGTNESNLVGTLVPFSFVNSIIGSIPLLGDVITGGSGQGVIAASFSVRGDLSDPEVSVNPVSLLTPGFLRNLFFSGKAEEESKKPESKP